MSFTYFSLSYMFIRRYPPWPGQVMDEHVDFISEKQRKRIVQSKMSTKPILVSFFGDRSFNWFSKRDIIPLETSTWDEMATGKPKTKELQNE